MCALGVALLGEVLKRAEAIGHIAKHTEASGREVLEVRIFGEVDPIDHPARLCVPVADARADGPVVIDVDLQFAFELVAPACAAILDVGRRSEVRPQEMTVLVQQISPGRKTASPWKVTRSRRRAVTSVPRRKDDHIDLLLMTSVPNGMAMDPGAPQ